MPQWRRLHGSLFQAGRSVGITEENLNLSMTAKQYEELVDDWTISINYFKNTLKKYFLKGTTSVCVKRRQGDVPWDAVHRTLKL